MKKKRFYIEITFDLTEEEVLQILQDTFDGIAVEENDTEKSLKKKAFEEIKRYTLETFMDCDIPEECNTRSLYNQLLKWFRDHWKDDFVNDYARMRYCQDVLGEKDNDYSISHYNIFNE